MTMGERFPEWQCAKDMQGESTLARRRLLNAGSNVLPAAVRTTNW